ncbi:MAG: flagellar hook-basal body complex protein FliE, partial [Chlamydiia bacterium]|nr:flagellar hook-basal body complex protein FliE [Chlamydiia bacterium]
MSEELAGPGKLDPIRMKALKNRAYVKEADLQLHVPSAMEPKQLDDSYSFKNVLTRYLDEVNTLQHDADAQIQRLVAGETDN